jgi:hypothetical protein
VVVGSGLILAVLSVIGIMYFVPIFLPISLQASPSNNTSSSSIDTGFLNNFWNDIITVISAIGSAATAAALIFVWKQSRIAQNEVTSTLRPWISSSKIRFLKPDRVEVTLKNQGRLPAKVFEPSNYLIDSSNEIKVKDLQQLGKGKVDYTFLMTPDDERRHDIRFDEEDKKITSGDTWFLGFVFYYSYANNLEGKYGAIVKWHNDTEEFGIVNEFVD